MEYSKNLIQCFETQKPIIVVLRPPLVEPSKDNIIISFLNSNDIDPHALNAEFSNFLAHIDLLRQHFQEYGTNCRVLKGMKILDFF